MFELNMPRLSDSMEEGTIVRWIVADGAIVRVGDEVAEIETDKAILPLEAVADGKLHIGAEEGSTLPVGTTIGWLLGENETPPAPAIAPERTESAAGNGGGRAVETREPVKVAASIGHDASPVARRTAAALGIDLAVVVGSGPNGRILKADVVKAESAPASKSSQPTAVSGGRGDVQHVALTRLQQTIARRMTESKATTPEFTLSIDVNMEQAVALRAEMKAVTDPTPSLNDLVIKALALALREHPGLNASYENGNVEQFSRINIGVAVAGPGTLLVPTVFDADQASVSTISSEVRRLAERARAGQLTPQEMTDSTATVTNLGMYGVKQFVGILNPPEAVILAVGAVEHRAIATDNGLQAGHLMTVTGTFDHRVVYGATGAELLRTFRELLERPLQLLL